MPRTASLLTPSAAVRALFHRQFEKVGILAGELGLVRGEEENKLIVRLTILETNSGGDTDSSREAAGDDGKNSAHPFNTQRGVSMHFETLNP